MMKAGYQRHYGPYRQSERTDIYNYLKKLFDENKAYYCFAQRRIRSREASDDEQD